MSDRPPFSERLDQRLVLLHRDGIRLYPYKEKAPDGRYAFVVGTGKSGGKKAGEEIFVDKFEEVLAHSLHNEKPVCVRPLDRSKAAAKFLVFGPHIAGYELAEEFLPLASKARQPPKNLPALNHDLAERARSFALREARPEQAAFREQVFLTCRGHCVISNCAVVSALDAAHREGRDWRKGHNHAEDGWLLRKDLHALYDAGLLSITPDGTVLLKDDEATRGHYGSYHGAKVKLPTSDA